MCVSSCPPWLQHVMTVAAWGVACRYCPSIEDKIVRFADKESHQIFLEPEGRNTPELYVQVSEHLVLGANRVELALAGYAAHVLHSKTGAGGLSKKLYVRSACSSGQIAVWMG